MSERFVHVYRTTPSGRRACFIFEFNPRLKYEPMCLSGFIVYDRRTGEYQSFVFKESSRPDLAMEFHHFVNRGYSEDSFRRICWGSLRAFISMINQLNPENLEMFNDNLF